MILIRRLHKWFGLILGLQFLLWAISGAAMALLDSDKVAAEDAILPVAQIPAPAEPLPLAVVAQAAGAPILKLKLKPLYDTYVYEVTTAGGVRLLDAVTAQPVTIDAAKARQLAVGRFSGQAQAGEVTYVARPTLETRELELPLWRVAFDDEARHALLVSARTGEVLAAKNDTWRLWDVFWMLHIMNYGDRQSFNHPLIATVATGAAWLALSGLILLLRSFRRSDVAWIADRVDTAGRRSPEKKTGPGRARSGS